jgi:hypothetical protein
LRRHSVDHCLPIAQKENLFYYKWPLIRLKVKVVVVVAVVDLIVDEIVFVVGIEKSPSITSKAGFRHYSHRKGCQSQDTPFGPFWVSLHYLNTAFRGGKH